MILRISFLFILILGYGPGVFATSPRVCHEIKVPVEDIISKIKTLRKKNDRYLLTLDLAKAYMVGSVHDEYVVCAPAYIRRDKDWGHFKPHKRGEPWDIIHWDGRVMRPKYLAEAKNLLDEISRKGMKDLLFYELFLSWVSEKAGRVEDAIHGYQAVFKVNKENLNKDFRCKLEPCETLMAMFESLKALKRIYKQQGKEEKVKKVDTLLEKYKKKVVMPNDFKGGFFKYMHKDDPEKLKKLDEFMKKHDVSK